MIRTGNFIAIILLVICVMCLMLWIIEDNMRAFWVMFITLGAAIWFFAVTNTGDKDV